MILEDRGCLHVYAVASISDNVLQFISSNSLVVSIGRINIPNHMLPQTNHPTALSVLHSDNSTVLNVLIDMVSFQHFLAISLVFT